MRTEKVYHCEYCDKPFFTVEDCWLHEQEHIKYYTDATDEEVSEKLAWLADIAEDYRIGNCVMGMPLENFVSLLETAAKRLKE